MNFKIIQKFIEYKFDIKISNIIIFHLNVKYHLISIMNVIEICD